MYYYIYTKVCSISASQCSPLIYKAMIWALTHPTYCSKSHFLYWNHPKPRIMCPRYFIAKFLNSVERHALNIYQLSKYCCTFFTYLLSLFVVHWVYKVVVVACKQHNEGANGPLAHHSHWPFSHGAEVGVEPA